MIPTKPQISQNPPIPQKSKMNANSNISALANALNSGGKPFVPFKPPKPQMNVSFQKRNKGKKTRKYAIRGGFIRLAWTRIHPHIIHPPKRKEALKSKNFPSAVCPCCFVPWFSSLSVHGGPKKVLSRQECVEYTWERSRHCAPGYMSLRSPAKPTTEAPYNKREVWFGLCG